MEKKKKRQSYKTKMSCIPCCCSVALLCPILCEPRNCSTSAFLVLHYLPEFTQSHVHRVSDAIQPSHPLSSPLSSCLQSFPASGSSPMSRLFTSGGPKYWSFSFSPSNEYSGLISFMYNWFDYLITLLSKELSRVFYNTRV